VQLARRSFEQLALGEGERVYVRRAHAGVLEATPA